MSKKKQNQLAVTVYVDGVAYGPDDDVPAAVAKQITNPKAWADGSAPEGESDNDAQAPSYSSLNKGPLADLIDERNEDREDDDKIVVAGDATKADLVAALEADDAAQAE